MYASISASAAASQRERRSIFSGSDNPLYAALSDCVLDCLDSCRWRGPGLWPLGRLALLSLAFEADLARRRDHKVLNASDEPREGIVNAHFASRDQHIPCASLRQQSAARVN